MSKDDENAWERWRRRIKRAVPRAAEVVVLAVGAFCLIVLLTQDLHLITRLIYSPLAVILLVVVLVEYLIIKGGDRSRLYKIEIERMQERERDYVARTRKALEEIERTLERSRGDQQDRPSSTELIESLKRIEKTLRPDLKE